MKNLLHFIEHSLSNVGQILIIALTAIALHYIVQLADITNSPLIAYGLKGAEYALFLFDMIWFLMVLYKALIKLINELWKN